MQSARAISNATPRRKSAWRQGTLIRRGAIAGSLLVVVLMAHALFRPALQSESPTRAIPKALRVGDRWRRLRASQTIAERGDDSVWKRHCKTFHSAAGRRILVTGSAGFIGFHTANAMARRGDAVVGLDNFNDYYPSALKRERAHALERLDVFTVEGDLTETKLLMSILDTCAITHVVHLAAQAGVRYAKEKPMTYVESNVQGTVALFEAARHAKMPPAIIYASSSSVYGSNTKTPFSEDDAVDNPTSLYGATKRSVELMAVVYHRLFDLSFTGLRFFTVYGPYGRPDMAAFKFARSILLQQPIKIYTSTDGIELSRDFTYIDDVVRGILGAVDTISPSEDGKATNEIFNLGNAWKLHPCVQSVMFLGVAVGNTHPVSVTEFVKSLERAMGQQTEKEYVAIKNTGDVLYTHANVTKAHMAFNFTPVVSLDEGLEKFATWFRNYSKLMPVELWTYPHHEKQ